MSQATADLARRFFDEVWNQRREDVLERLAQPDAVSHRSTGETVSVAGFRETVHRPFTEAIPDLRIEVEDVVASDNQAVVRWRSTGTHAGDGFGCAPSGQHIDFRGMTWLVFRDDKVVEGWDCWDETALKQKLSTPV